jgi:hypothetical protein
MSLATTQLFLNLKKLARLNVPLGDGTACLIADAALAFPMSLIEDHPIFTMKLALTDNPPMGNQKSKKTPKSKIKKDSKIENQKSDNLWLYRTQYAKPMLEKGNGEQGTVRSPIL